jgi:hypothetical protein
MLALANPDMPMHDGQRVLPVLEDSFLSEVQVVDSLPLEEFSALPPLPCVNFTGVCSHREVKGAIPLELL